MEIRLIKTIGGQWRIVDAWEDDSAPFITFHNDFNNEEIAKRIFEFLCENKEDCSI